MNGKLLRQNQGRISLFFAVVLATSAFGNWEDIKSKEFDMSPPPREGTAAYKKDFQVVHEYQKTRDKAACELAEGMAYPTYKAYYADILTKREFANAKDLMERVLEYGIKVAEHFKEIYERPRPYVTDPSIKPCAKKPGGSKSYPSGHATSASVSACILADLYPSKAKQITDWGKYLGDLRVIVGVHHPSDVVAGQKLGNDICERLLSDDDFAEELDELR